MIRNLTLLFCRKVNFTVLARKMSIEESDVLFKEVHDKGIIILNRLKALNSLNLSMVNKIYPILSEWETKKKLVIVKGAGEKAFCAGGDVKAIIEAGFKGNKQLGRDFFKNEYKTNGLIGSYKIPYIALIDGIVMGGGVGLSVHGQYRIATERTLFAMPETQIGLFPDVGGSYFLPRMPGQLGLYLALTGIRLKGSDVFKAGIATHYVNSKDLNDLELALLECTNDQDIKNVLLKFSVKESPDFSLKPVLDQINTCFSPQTIEEIISRLKADGSNWAQDTLKILSKMSPTSMKVTLKELEIGKKLTLDECLKMEYNLAVNCLENKDFYEGKHI